MQFVDNLINIKPKILDPRLWRGSICTQFISLTNHNKRYRRNKKWDFTWTDRCRHLKKRSLSGKSTAMKYKIPDQMGLVHINEHVIQKLKRMINYRWIASYTSDTTFNQRYKVCNRSAKVIIPRTLTFLLIKIMKNRSLGRISNPNNFWASNTTISKPPKEN